MTIREFISTNNIDFIRVFIETREKDDFDDYDFYSLKEVESFEDRKISRILDCVFKENGYPTECFLEGTSLFITVYRFNPFEF